MYGLACSLYVCSLWMSGWIRFADSFLIFFKLFIIRVTAADTESTFVERQRASDFTVQASKKFFSILGRYHQYPVLLMAKEEKKILYSRAQ